MHCTHKCMYVCVYLLCSVYCVFCVSCVFPKITFEHHAFAIDECYFQWDKIPFIYFILIFNKFRLHNIRKRVKYIEDNKDVNLKCSKLYYYSSGSYQEEKTLISQVSFFNTINRTYQYLHVLFTNNANSRKYFYYFSHHVGLFGVNRSCQQ